MTKFRDIFSALIEPFEATEVKIRHQAGREIHYITARTAMNRLDTVMGPENWWDEYVPSQNSVLCRLTVRLPDGQTLTKSDAGGYAGMADSGDDDKSGFSDAFKRAAVKFGVARYLYHDGVPDFRDADPIPPQADSEVDRPRLAPSTTQTRNRWDRWIIKLLGRWGDAEPITGEDDRIAREHRIAHALISEAGPEFERHTWKPAEAGKKPRRDPYKVWEMVHRLAAGNWEWTKAATLRYLQKHVKVADEPRNVQQETDA